MSESTAVQRPDRTGHEDPRRRPRAQRAAAADDAEGFALDATHVPHITVLQRYVRTPELEQVLDAVGAHRRRRGPRGADPPRRRDRPRGVGHAGHRHGEPDARARPSAARTAGQTDRRARAVRVDPGDGRGVRDGPGGARRQRDDDRLRRRASCPTTALRTTRPTSRSGWLGAAIWKPSRPSRSSRSTCRAEAVAAYQLGNNGTARRRLRAWPVAERALNAADRGDHGQDVRRRGPGRHRRPGPRPLQVCLSAQYGQ